MTGMSNHWKNNRQAHKMWRCGAFMVLFVGWSGQVSTANSIICPDGHECSDLKTCCETPHGYSCCIYPQAVCCPDLAHCCPLGYRCVSTTQMCERDGHPMFDIGSIRRMAVPGQSGSGSPSLLAASRLQGPHTHGATQGLKPPALSPGGSPAHPATQTSSPGNRIHKLEEEAGSDAMGVTPCGVTFYCPADTSCCKGPTQHWSCCPYPLGYCCLDGVHCCQRGYTCDPSYVTCRRWEPSGNGGTRMAAKRY